MSGEDERSKNEALDAICDYLTREGITAEKLPAQTPMGSDVGAIRAIKDGVLGHIHVDPNVWKGNCPTPDQIKGYVERKDIAGVLRTRPWNRGKYLYFRVEGDILVCSEQDKDPGPHV